MRGKSMTKAAATLTGVVALLLVEPATCFLPAQQSGVTFKNGNVLRCAKSSPRICVDAFQQGVRVRASGRRRPRPAARQVASIRAMGMAAEGERGSKTTRRKTVAIETSEGVPRGPEGAIKLTYLEINSWMCQVNGLNLLVDPLFGTLDFGVPVLVQAKKKVLWDAERVTRDLAAVTDFLVISQGIDDHCHPPTIQALAGLLDPSVRVVAPPSAQAVLEAHFPASRITYLLPGQSTVLSKEGRAVEVRATSGATLGPPWQQAENGYLFSPAAANEKDRAPDGGTLYFEAHLMFNKAELSALKADVVIAPVVSQSVGPFPLVNGGAAALELASVLKASKLVTMANADGDFSGPLGKAVTEGASLEDFLVTARAEGRTVVVPEPAEPLSAWP